jgi:hypothetical protein
VLGAAQEELMDEARREPLMRVLEYARDAVRAERRKATKHDTALRIAASLHAEGREGVEAAWEETEDFHAKWKIKSRDVLARAEFRRRKLNKRCARAARSACLGCCRVRRDCSNVPRWHKHTIHRCQLCSLLCVGRRRRALSSAAGVLHGKWRAAGCRQREEEARLEADEKDKAKARKQAHTDRKEWLDKRGSRLASWKDFNKTVRARSCARAPVSLCAELACLTFGSGRCATHHCLAYEA